MLNAALLAVSLSGSPWVAEAERAMNTCVKTKSRDEQISALSRMIEISTAMSLAFALERDRDGWADLMDMIDACKKAIQDGS